MKRFSHSRLDTFENCGLQFKYRYLDQIETKVETIEAFMGKRVHETLEKLYTMKMEGQLPLLDALVTHYHTEWEQHWHENIRVVKKEKTAVEYREKGEEYIKQYYEEKKPFNQVETVSLEERITLPLSDGKYIIRGYIDRLAKNGGTYEIHDYKTGNYIPSRKALEKDRQLTLYALAVLKTYEDAENVELIWHYLAHDKEIRVTPSRETMEQVKEETVDAIENVQTAKEEDDFPANVSKLCHWCEFQKICPEWEHVFQDNKLPENEYMTQNGGELVDQYITVKDAENLVDEEKIRKLEEALVVYALKHDTDTVEGERGTATVDFEQVPDLPEQEAERETLRDVLKHESLWQHIDQLSIDSINTAITTHIDEAEQDQVAARIADHLHTQTQPQVQITRRTQS